MGTLILDPGNCVNLETGTGNPGVALYVSQILGAILSGNTISNIFSNGSNIYYDRGFAGNAYLDGKVYALSGIGFLEPIPASEPETLPMLLSGLGLLSLLRRRSRR